jgi:hypothetical protein
LFKTYNLKSIVKIIRIGHKKDFFNALQPKSGLGRFVLGFLDHTHTHTHTHSLSLSLTHIAGRIPLSERSARRRGHHLHNTQQTQETNIHALSGIGTRDSNNQAASTYALDHAR